MHRVVFIGGLLVLLSGCASNNRPQVKEPEWPEGSVPLPASAQQAAPATARESDAAPIAPASAAPEVPQPPLGVPASPAAGGKLEVLGEMSDSTPGAASVTRPPCNLAACAVVLGITTREVAESVAHDDGGPGTYVPEGMISMETAGQPGVWDAYGVEKLIQVWVITVQPRDGAVQVIQQRSSPAFSVGDSVLLEGDVLLPWN